MSLIRILAIEDDPIYAESLRLVLEELGYLLIEVTDDIHEFFRLIKATLPDILLIDIDLGLEMDGIQLAEKVNQEVEIPFLFVTSYKDSQTVLRAKDVLPAAYITKPYEPASLQAAVEIAMKQPKTVQRNLVDLPANTQSFFLKEEEGLTKVRLDEILFIEVNEKYCTFHLAHGSIKVNIRLKEILDRLPDQEFVQVHRSYVVAVNYIDLVDSNFHKVLIGDHAIPVGRSFRVGLQLRINRIG